MPKVKVYIKAADAVIEAVGDAAEKEVSDAGVRPVHAGYHRAKFEAEDRLLEALLPWIKFNEHIWIEFDTDAGTATVLPADR